MKKFHITDADRQGCKSFDPITVLIQTETPVADAVEVAEVLKRHALFQEHLRCEANSRDTIVIGYEYVPTDNPLEWSVTVSFAPQHLVPQMKTAVDVTPASPVAEPKPARKIKVKASDG